MAELLFAGWGGEDDEDSAEQPLHPQDLQDATSSISTPAVLSATATKRRDKLDAREVARVATRAAKKERKKAANVLARAAREAAEAPAGGHEDAVRVGAMKAQRYANTNRRHEREARRESIKRAMAAPWNDGGAAGLRVCIDLGLQGIMNRRELKSLANQVAACYGDTVRRCAEEAGRETSEAGEGVDTNGGWRPLRLALTSAAGPALASIQKVGGFEQWPVQCHAGAFREAVEDLCSGGGGASRGAGDGGGCAADGCGADGSSSVGGCGGGEDAGEDAGDNAGGSGGGGSGGGGSGGAGRNGGDTSRTCSGPSCSVGSAGDSPGRPPNGSIVMMSPDAAEPLLSIEPASVYVIGGLCDYKRVTNATRDQAEAQGVVARRLPIAECMGDAQGERVSCDILAVNHVAAILLEAANNGGDFEAALRLHVPRRKVSGLAPPPLAPPQASVQEGAQVLTASVATTFVSHQTGIS